MNTAQFLNDLGLTMGLSDLVFNDEGCARLVFDGKIGVNFESDAETGHLFAYTTLGPLPAQGREGLYLSLLEANLLSATEHFGATLAVDSLNNEVVLCRHLMTDELSTQSFNQIIENFVNCAEQWRYRLEHAGPETAPAPLSGGAPVSVSGFIRG